MKKILCFLLTMLLLISLTGCNQTQKEQLQKVIDQDVGKEMTYTSASYSCYETAVTDAQAIISRPFASMDSITRAQDRLQSAIHQLKVATKGIYQIDYEFIQKSNNSVGNRWQNTVTHNGLKFSSGQRITAAFHSVITLEVTVIERDSIPDKGQGTVSLVLTDGADNFTEIAVQENRGKYSGCTALWEFRCSATLIGRL